uniref:Putative ovule protein n=1 Tax=Solanum chacoense TaxID=4108 RepID=A0A0V0GQ02_SOLCH
MLRGVFSYLHIPKGEVCREGTLSSSHGTLTFFCLLDSAFNIVLNSIQRSLDVQFPCIGCNLHLLDAFLIQHLTSSIKSSLVLVGERFNMRYIEISHYFNPALPLTKTYSWTLVPLWILPELLT